MSLLIKVAGAGLLASLGLLGTAPFWLDRAYVTLAPPEAVASAYGAIREAVIAGMEGEPSPDVVVWLGGVAAAPDDGRGGCRAAPPVEPFRLVRLEVDLSRASERETHDGVELPVVGIRIEGDEPVMLALTSDGPAFWRFTGARAMVRQATISDGADGVFGAAIGVPGERLVRVSADCAARIWPAPYDPGPGAPAEALWTVGSADAIEPDRPFDEWRSIDGAAFVIVSGGGRIDG